MGNQFVFPTGTAAPVTVRVFASSGDVLRKSAADGGTDPFGFVAFDTTEAAGGQYDFTTLEVVGADGEFVFTMPDGTPEGAHSFRAMFGGGVVAVATMADVGYWDGENFAIGFTAADRAMLTALFGGGLAASAPAATGAAFDPVAAETAVYWAWNFLRPIELDGWTKLTFTVKADIDNDDDADALIVLSVSNPADPANDGIKVHNRRPVPLADPLRTSGQFIATSVSPETSLFVSLFPLALMLPPSPDTSPYSFEIDYWYADGIKRQFGRGDFRLDRSVRRGIVAP